MAASEQGEELRQALSELLEGDLERDHALRCLNATRTLKTTNRKNKELAIALIAEGAFQSFGIALQRFAKDEEVCLTAIRATANFARATDAVASMVEHDLPVLLIRTIRRHITSQTVVEIGVLLLADAGVNLHFKDLVRIHNGIEVIGDAMSVHKTNPKLLDVCFYCLANLSVQSPENITNMVDCGCLRVVIDGMLKFPEIPTLVEGALAIILNICRNGVSEQRAVADLNGCHALIEVLKPLGTDDVQRPLIKQCLLTIGTFASSQENIDLLLDENGINVMCGKIIENNNDADLQQVGISVVAKLTVDCSDNTLPILLETRAFGTVLSIAKANPYNLGIQTAVLQLFLCLYSRFSNSHSQLLGMIRLFAIPIALSTMYCFPSNPIVADAAVSLLGGILTDNHARCRLESIDILPTVVRVAMEQIKDPNIVRVVLDVLGELVTLNISVASIKGSRALDVVRYIISQPEPNAACLDSALTLLSRLVTHTELSELVAVTLAEPLVTIANSPSTSRTSTFKVLAAIFGDIGTSFGGADVLTGLGVLDLQLRILGEEARHPVIVAAIIDSLRKIMRTSIRSRSELKEKGAIRMVETLRFQHATDARVNRTANDFLRDIESTTMAHSGNVRINTRQSANTDAFKLPELPQTIRLFLVAGGVLTKHCKRALPRKKTVFISPDLRFLVWRDPNKPSSKPSSLYLDNADRVEAGRVSTELKRESAMLFVPAEEGLAFAVFMKDGRTMSAEAPTAELRDEWVRCLTELINYRQELARMSVHKEEDPLADPETEAFKADE